MAWAAHSQPQPNSSGVDFAYARNHCVLRLDSTVAVQSVSQTAAGERTVFAQLAALRTYAWSNLGRCNICTRRALLAAASAWASVAVMAAVGAGQFYLSVAAACGAGMTVLWIAHLAVFSRKVSAVRTGALAHEHTNQRRAVLKTFARVFAGAAIASVAPRIAAARDNPCPQCDCGYCLNCETGEHHCVSCQVQSCRGC